MFVDTRELPAGHRIESDVCIIGAGAAGITLALALRDSNLKICVLEGGGLEPDASHQALYDGATSGLPYTPLQAARVRCFGGTTNHWSGWCRPLDPIDFERRSWVPHSGWPIGIDDLIQYFPRTQGIFGLTTLGFDPSSFSTPTSPRLPLDGRAIETTVFRFTAPARFGQMYRAPIDAASDVAVYLYANATQILPDEKVRRIEGVDAKTLTGRTVRFVAKTYVLATGGIENARLLLASNSVQSEGLGNSYGLVGRFFMDHPGVASGFVLFNDPKQSLGLYTGVMREASLLAQIDGGSMQQFISPGDKQRILDWVESGAGEAEYNDVIAPILQRQCVTCHNPDGIAFQRTLQSYREVMRVLPSTGSGAAARSATVGEQRDALGALVLTPAAQSADKVLNYCAILEDSRGWSELVDDDSIWDSVGHVAANFGTLWSAAFRRAFDAGSRRRLMRVVNVFEPSPNPDSTVTLSRDRDALGVPRVNLDWRLNDTDHRTIAIAHDRLAAELGRTGLGRMLREFDEHEEGWRNLTHGWHHMGTTRMHQSPQQGVVDANCRVHGLDNLYVAGSSVFPTYGFSQPTFTIVALALRLADRIRSIVD